MSTCDICGEPIEFRYMGGRPTPIHLKGGWCSAVKSPAESKDQRPFRSSISYADPNALCPVCGSQVFFYQNAAGSRVFFDDLGWPWPKHPCTDNSEAQTLQVKKAKSNRRLAGRGRPIFNLYALAELSTNDDLVTIKIRSLTNRLLTMTLRISLAELMVQACDISELEEAPSFVLRNFDDARTIEFISASHRRIGRVIFRKKTA
jgi:hypothetical protein